MAKTIASADITKLDFSVLIDLSSAIPVASVTNLSTVVTAANLQWVFEFTSPSGTPLYVGSFDSPDVDGVPFTTFNFPNPIQQIFRQVEFDASNPYTVKVSVKDDAGDIYDLSKGQALCKPNGNNNKNNFGAALIDMVTRCTQGNIFLTDHTNLIYKSLVGTKVTTSVTLTYPKDPNGNTIAASTRSTLPALMPLYYDGDGHEITMYHIYDYDLGDFFYVRIRYSFAKVFPISCNVTLEPLYCEIDKISAILEKDCPDTVENRRRLKQLTLANGKILKASIGILQPLSNWDVPAIVEEIKELLGIECDCCRPAGINSIGTALATDAIFTEEIVCGDMTAEWENDGLGNINLKLGNKIYTFAMSDDAASSQAFEFTTNPSGGCTKATTLFVDRLELATEMLTEIQNNSTLLNILNDITQRAQLTCSGLDGGDAFNLSSCDYNLLVNTSVAGQTFDWVLINGVTYNAPGGTLMSNASAIQTFLNGLSKGTFVVIASGETVTITSSANTNTLAMIQVTTSGNPRTITFNNNCGLICNILQKIFDYLNAINLVQVKTGLALTVCRFNPDGTSLPVTFADNVLSSVVMKYIADSLCNIVDYTKTRLLSCENLQALFATFTNLSAIPNSADIVLMNVNGVCQKVPVKVLGMSIFQLLSSDSDVKSIYCAGAKCTTVSDCSPVADLVGSIADTTASFSWTGVAGAIGYKWSKDGATWFFVGSTSAYVTGLTAATAYTFRVYPVYNSGDGSDCVVTNNFTTTNAGAACAAPGSLALDNVMDTSFRATWATVTGASGYQYRVNGAGWINAGLVLTVNVSGLTPDTVYNFEVRAIIGGTPCVESSTASTTTALANNYTLLPGYSMDITSVTGTGVPAIGPTSGSALHGHHTAMSGTYSVVVSGTPAIPAKLVGYVNGAVVSTINITVAGTYSLSITATEPQDVLISIDSQ